MGRKNKIKQPFTVTQYQLDDEVTGSCYIVDVDGLKILVNYGGHQDNSLPPEKVYDINRQKMKLPLDKIDFIILPESHSDHVMLCGLLGRSDIVWNGIGITTEPCAEATKLILLDSARIMQSECDKYNINHPDKKKLRPLYTRDEVEDFMSTVRCYGQEEEIKLSSNVTVTLYPNGHLLGSSMVYITYDDGEIIRRLLITSDYYKGDTHRPFTKSIIDKKLKCDCVITESTYAGRYHPKATPSEYLESVIEEYVVGKNKILFIPTFAQARMSQMFYHLTKILERNSTIANANIPIYLCSAMGEDMHRIYGKKEYDCYKDEEWHGLDSMFNGSSHIKFISQKKDLDNFVLRGNSRKIVVSASGMVQGGYSVAIAEKFLKNNKVVFLPSGYIAEGCIGHEIARDDKPEVLINGVRIPNNMTVLPTIPNMSSHADTEGLVRFFKENCNLNILKHVMICHGGHDERIALKTILENELPKKIAVQIFNQYDKVKF